MGHHKVGLPALSPWCIWHVGTMQDLEDTVYSKSEEPLIVHRFLTWWLTDVCGSSAILLAVHLARITTEPLQRLSDKYRPTGSDLATLGSVQLRQTLALWTLAWGKVTTRDECRHIVNTGTLQWSTLWKKERRKERIAVTPIYLQSMRKHGLCTCYSEIAHLKHHIIRTGILLVAATIEYKRL